MGPSRAVGLKQKAERDCEVGRIREGPGRVSFFVGSRGCWVEKPGFQSFHGGGQEGASDDGEVHGECQ